MTCLLGTTAGVADQPHWVPTDELQASHVDVPTSILETRPTDAIAPSIELSEDIDPIERELRLQRAIADSLYGDNQKAIDSLGEPDRDDTAAMYASAMWMMQNGKVDEGMQTLRLIADRDDAPPETHKFLAVGHLHLDQPQSAEAAADIYLDANQDDAYTHYVRGLAILRQDDPVRAHDSLRQAGYDEDDVAQIQTVAMQVPVDVRQRRLTIGEPIKGIQNRSRYDDGCDSLGGASAQSKPYNFTILFAGEYDSNVPLQPRFSGLGSNFDHDDYRFLMASFLDLQLMSTEDFNLGLVGSTYNTFQVDANEFNIQDYMGGAYTNALLSEDLVGALRYEYHHTLVDSDRFADEHRLTPSMTWLGSRGHTTLFYEFNPINSRAPFLIPAQNQSTDIHRTGITQALYTFGGDGRVYGGYQYAEGHADGSDFDVNTHMVTGRIERPLPRQWIADLDVRYVWDDYANPNSLDFYDRARDDERVEVRAGLQRNFVAPVSLRFDYTYINNDSNTENLFGVRFYDYDRHIVSTQLIFSL
ncbi:hypothetical protein [Novipirellula maiorica]|nr:hypothetical protein [Rhodopirellula maiorica]